MTSLLSRVKRWCLNQSPWQQRGFVFLLGGLSVLSLAPFFYWPILFLTLPLFLLSHEGCTAPRSGFWLGWWFGFGYFTFGLYWIANALFVDLASFWWVIPFAVMGLPFALSFFWAVASLLVTKIASSTLSRWILFAVFFSATEWLRGHLFTGFPWNLLGYSWVETPLLQMASWVGIYGLTLYTFILCGIGYFYLSGNKRKLPLILITILTIGICFYGAIRSDQVTRLPSTENALRLVQPNIAQREKWNADKMPSHFDKLVALSSQPSEKDIAAIIWPETATSFFDTFAIRQFDASVPNFLSSDQHLITGVLDYGRDKQGKITAYNRLSVFNHQGERTQKYDKHHLVPFGEYLPFQNYLPFNPIASDGVMFTAGAGPQTLWLEGLPAFSPLICYEAIFPHDVIKDGNSRPAWLLNLTNDAWYGKSTGPYQHLTITQLRAVEEGIPLVRVANTGISAVIDTSGKIIASIPLQEAGVIDINLPASVKTLYAEIGDAGFFFMLFVLTGFAIIIRDKSSDA